MSRPSASLALGFFLPLDMVLAPFLQKRAEVSHVEKRFHVGTGTPAPDEKIVDAWAGTYVVIGEGDAGFEQHYLTEGGKPAHFGGLDTYALGEALVSLLDEQRREGDLDVLIDTSVADGRWVVFTLAATEYLEEDEGEYGNGECNGVEVGGSLAVDEVVRCAAFMPRLKERLLQLLGPCDIGRPIVGVLGSEG